MAVGVNYTVSHLTPLYSCIARTVHGHRQGWHEDNADPDATEKQSSINAEMRGL